ncbi:MAG: M15 family metallopeptidase, partial [Bacteroidota bacterium]|nr:M15 family metallopeptidase [Bacteroidota bacterium]
KKDKDFANLLNNPDIQDMFSFKYTKYKLDTPRLNYDPGRIRNQAFFLKMYGKNKSEVSKNLTTVYWLPSTVNKKILVTKINNVNQKIQAISNELDNLPHLHKYVNNMAGTFYWRKISGTNRLSTHSFGIAIDINVKYSNYWKWEKNVNPNNLKYKNKIPLEIINIFEKYGFIWGGKWYHFDTMHFEYRPELL